MHIKSFRGFLTFVVLAISLLFPTLSFAQAPTFTRPMTLGATGSDVSTLQQILKTQGYFTYPTITGYYGSYTFLRQ